MHELTHNRVDLWRQVYNKDPEQASRLCDTIVLKRDVPLALVSVLATSHALLTERQIVVLQELAKVSTYKEVAARLNVSSETIRTHMSHIMRRLNVHTRHEAIALGIRIGLID